MTPGFSLRRIVFRRRYLHALIATDPHEAAARCINYWASKWRSTPVETPGMREQLAQTLQMHGVLVEEPRFFFGSDLPSDHLFTMDDVLSMRRAAK